jgi:4-amino-4-deoxy-L-arabinose transferase-like glycosyltransferase
MVAPWAIAIGEATEGRFFAEALGRDMFGKLGEAQESHSGPPGYHLAFVWILFWPAAALLLPGFAKGIRTRAAWPAYFLLAWIIPSWLIFEFTATKLPHYTLPLYPALAILAARAAASGEAGRRILWRKLGAASYLATGLVVSVLIVALPLFLGGSTKTTALSAAAAALIGAGSLGVAALFWRGSALRGAFASAGLGAVLAWSLLALVLPSLDRLAISPRLSAALDEAGLHSLRDGAPPVAIAGFYEPSAVFLLGTETKLTGGGGAARHLIDHPGAAVAVDARLDDEFHEGVKSLGVSPRALAVIDGLNYSNGRSISLTIYAAPDE